jgi:hypothetical protein
MQVRVGSDHYDINGVSLVLLPANLRAISYLCSRDCERPVAQDLSCGSSTSGGRQVDNPRWLDIGRNNLEIRGDWSFALSWNDRSSSLQGKPSKDCKGLQLHLVNVGRKKTGCYLGIINFLFCGGFPLMYRIVPRMLSLLLQDIINLI